MKPQLLQQPSRHAVDWMSPDAPLSEHQLLEAMLEGDERAWVLFHQRFDRLIYRCISGVTTRFSSVLSGDDVGEIYATLVLQLLSNDMHKLRSFDPARGNRFSSWIGMLAINSAYDHLRALRREPGRGSLSEAEAICCEGDDPFSQVDRRQREQRLAEMLSDLSAKDRLFMRLYFDQGLEPEEVAARMGISVKTVYSKKHKIRARLERMLHGEVLAA